MAIQKPRNKKAPIDAVVSPLILVDPGRKQLCIGTVFIVGAMGKDAIGITARHSIEFAMNFEPTKRAPPVPGSFFQVATPKREFSRIEMRCMFDLGIPRMFGKVPAEVEAVYSHKDTDIAYVHLRLEEGHRDVCKIQSSIPILSTNVERGEPVRVIGFHQDGMNKDQRKVSGLPRTGTVDPAAFTMVKAKLKDQVADVVELLPDGYLDSRFPLFRVNCPFESGLSGGPVLVERDGIWIAAGMVCRDQQVISETCSTGKASGVAACAATINASLSVPLPDVKYYSSAQEEPKILTQISDLIGIGVLKLM